MIERLYANISRPDSARLLLEAGTIGEALLLKKYHVLGVQVPDLSDYERDCRIETYNLWPIKVFGSRRRIKRAQLIELGPEAATPIIKISPEARESVACPSNGSGWFIRLRKGKLETFSSEEVAEQKGINVWANDILAWVAGATGLTVVEIEKKGTNTEKRGWVNQLADNGDYPLHVWQAYIYFKYGQDFGAGRVDAAKLLQSGMSEEEQAALVGWLDGCPRRERNVAKMGVKQYTQEHLPECMLWHLVLDATKGAIRSNSCLYYELRYGWENVPITEEFDLNSVPRSFGERYIRFGLARESAYEIVKNLGKLIDQKGQSGLLVGLKALGQLSRNPEISSTKTLSTAFAAKIASQEGR